MTIPMRSAESFADEIFLQYYPGQTQMIQAIQADALAWAADQIRLSHSMEEAAMRLSLKHQELVKAKK